VYAQTKHPKSAQGVIELKISGPGLIRTGREVRFKIIVANRLSHPIIIADRSTGNELSNFTWSIVNATGKEVPTGPIDPKHPTKVWIDTMAGPLSDTAVHVLVPGAELLYKRASDPTVASCEPRFAKLDGMECVLRRIFPGKGVYRFQLHYRFAPAGKWDYTDNILKTLTLSPANIEVLQTTPAVDIASNEWRVSLE